MNILHVISAPAPGGAEVYVMDLSKELARQGHDVHIGFLGHAGDTGHSPDFERECLRNLTNAGVRWFFLGHVVRRLPWLGIHRVRNYVVENRIQIYHSHLTLGVIFGAMVRVPRVYTHHNIKMRVSRFTFSLISPLIDEVVGISEVCTSALADHARRKVTTIYNGVDSKKLTSGELRHRETGAVLRCIAVGRICEQKNYGMLVRAIGELSPDVRSMLKVTIVGDGPKLDIDSLRQLIADECLQEIIELVGHQSNVPALLSKSHLFLMTSAFEGLPIALIEAALSGLPCVVTDVGGCREVIEICKNGVVVEPGNETDFANAIERIVNDRTKLAEYSADALRYSRVFDIAHSCRAHIALYDEIRQCSSVGGRA